MVGKNVMAQEVRKSLDVQRKRCCKNAKSRVQDACVGVAKINRPGMKWPVRPVEISKDMVEGGIPEKPQCRTVFELCLIY